MVLVRITNLSINIKIQSKSQLFKSLLVKPHSINLARDSRLQLVAGKTIKECRMSSRQGKAYQPIDKFDDFEDCKLRVKEILVPTLQ